MLPVTQVKGLVLTGWLTAPGKVNGILRREVYVAIFDLRLFSTLWLQNNRDELQIKQITGMQNLAKRKTNAYQVKCKTVCLEECSVTRQQDRFKIYF